MQKCTVSPEEGYGLRVINVLEVHSFVMSILISKSQGYSYKCVIINALEKLTVVVLESYDQGFSPTNS